MKQRDKWNSRAGFIFASVGSAVGLGNIWRFPTEVGRNGGGAFVLLYLIIILLIGIPVMICELTIGRKGQKDIVGSYTSIKKSPLWYGVGFLGILAGFIILSFYSVIAGWGLNYIVKFFDGSLTGNLSGAETGEIFASLTANPLIPLFYQLLFIGVTTFIVVKGIGKGIEKFSKYLMPLLILLLIALAIRAVALEGALEGVIWYLRPDFSEIGVATVLGALGQVFFSLSLGMGAILTYGSYLDKKANIPQNAMIISISDLLISIIAGLIIIPAVFAFGLEVEAGPPLIFITLPVVFGAMPFGAFFGALFFILLSIAAITSSISILEVIVAYFVDEKKWNRKKATMLAGVLIFAVSIPISLSQGLLADVRLLGLDFLDLADAFTGRLLLPLSGLFSVIFIGWVWKRDNALIHIREENIKFSLGETWLSIVKYVLPLVMVYILISGLLDSF